MNRSCTCEWNMHVTVPLLVNGSYMYELDLQLTSTSSHVNGTIAQGNAIKHEIHISISTYHAISRQALSYTMPCPPGHTIYHAIPLQAIPYIMPCPPGDIISHIPCHISPGHTICHAMADRPYHIPCQTSPGHIIYYAMPTRPYHIPCHTSPGHDIICHARQAILYTMTYPSDNNIYHATPRQVNLPYTMPCPSDHAIYHAMSARQYHILCQDRQAIPCTCHPAKPHHIPPHTAPGNTIYHTMPARRYHISCHCIQAIPYTRPWPADHAIYHVMSARPPYHIPCNVGSRPSLNSLN